MAAAAVVVVVLGAATGAGKGRAARCPQVAGADGAAELWEGGAGEEGVHTAIGL